MSKALKIPWGCIDFLNKFNWVNWHQFTYSCLVTWCVKGVLACYLYLFSCAVTVWVSGRVKQKEYSKDDHVTNERQKRKNQGKNQFLSSEIKEGYNKSSFLTLTIKMWCRLKGHVRQKFFFPFYKIAIIITTFVRAKWRQRFHHVHCSVVESATFFQRISIWFS